MKSETKIMMIRLRSIFFFCALIQITNFSGYAAETPRQLKANAIVVLEGISTSERNVRRIIKQAIKEIEKSLSHNRHSRFIDDTRLRPPPEGRKVFEHERHAVRALTRGLKNQQIEESVKVQFQVAIDAMVEADRRIALWSLETAELLVQTGRGNGRELEKARRKFQKALTESKPEKAIEAFKQAWTFSQKIVDGKNVSITTFDDAPDPFSPPLTSNILNVVFNVDLKGEFHKEKEKAQYFIELVEIILDSNNAIVRTISIRDEIDLPGFHSYRKKRPTKFELTAAWDGLDDAGAPVDDASFTYLAFGNLIKVRSHGGRHGKGKHGKGRHGKKREHGPVEKIAATSFPVRGEIQLDATAPEIAIDGITNGQITNQDVTPIITVTDAQPTTTEILFNGSPYTSGAAITTEGNHTLDVSAADAAGNSATASLTFVLDKTPPEIAASISPEANAAGWHKTDVAISYSATDALSGIETVSPDTLIATEGPGQTFTGTAVDLAGNVKTVVSTLNIDKTPPVVDIIGVVNTQITNQDITPVVTVLDSNSVSSMVLLNGAPFTSGTPITVDGNYTLAVTAADVAGNSTTTSLSFTLDKTPPEIVATTAPAANPNGWNNSDVTVAFTAADNLSGIASVSSDVIVTTEGAAQVITGTATDLAGNSATTSSTLNIDKTAPEIEASAAPTANANGWNNTDVAIAYSATDNLSGIDTVSPDIIVTTEGANQTFTGTVVDLAGNSRTVSSTLNIDKTPPAIFITGVTDTQITNQDITPIIVISDFLSASSVSSVVQLNGVPFTSGTTISADGNYTIDVTAIDLAGNSTTTSLFFTIDKIPPVIVATATPPANANGWNNTDVAVNFTATDTLSGIAAVTPDITVVTEGAAQVITATAADLAGNVDAVSLTLNIDKTLPSVAVNSLADGTLLVDPNISLTGSVDDSLAGIATLTCNGSPATISGTSFSCNVTLSEGGNAFSVVATDLAGNQSSVTHNLTLDTQPGVTINSPTNGLVTADTAIDVSGTISGSVAVTVNGISATISGASFTATNVPLNEGANSIIATAENFAGATAASPVTIRRDTVAPIVVFESPLDGDRLVTATITIAGTVNDIIPGATINDDDVTVTINGQPALVNNRTFLLADAALEIGSNTFTATAVDKVGNMSSSTITVTREPDLTGIRLVIVSGNAQRLAINAPLPDPLVVNTQAADGTPQIGRPVIFTVSRGDGLLDDPLNGERTITLLTDANGDAQIPFILGSRTGEGFHRVRVTTPGSLTFAEFCATAETSSPGNLSLVLPPPKLSVINQPLSNPITTFLTDAGGNPVNDFPVVFQIDAGGGHFDGAATITVLTSTDGIAQATWTLGPDLGISNNKASATFAGNPGFPVAFAVSGVIAGPVQHTSVSGIVQDSTTQPIVGARVIIKNTALEAFTGLDGKFVITNVLPGGHHVAILASEANDAANNIVFPNIEYALEVISGIDNPLDQVVVLPFLNMDGARLAGGDEDVVLEMDGVPGATVTILAHSTFVKDADTGDLVQQPVLMSTSQVKIDKLPMVPPQGAAPMLVGTLQPSGIIFNPPAEVTLPNFDVLAPGDVADMFSFDHDQGQFVNIGPGTVSDDGAFITSDPGFGIVESGWFCMIRFPGQAAQCTNNHGCKAELKWKVTHASGATTDSGPFQAPSTIFPKPLMCALDMISSTMQDEIIIDVKFDHQDPPGHVITSAEIANPSTNKWSVDQTIFEVVSEPAPSATTAQITLKVKTDQGSKTRVKSPLYTIHYQDQAGQPVPDSQCQVEVEIISTKVEIGSDSNNAFKNEYVDRDDPTLTFSSDKVELPDNTILYAGESTGDYVSWKVFIEPLSVQSNVTNYTWTAEGPENISGPSGPGQSEWKIDDNGGIDWKPGQYKVKLEVTFDGVTQCIAEYDQEIGLRTEEYFVVGAILTEASVPTAGVDSSTVDHFECPEIAFRLLFQDFNDPNDAEHVPEEVEDRIYVNYRIINTTNNISPIGFIDANSDPNDAFDLDGDTHYRFFGRCQFRYKVNPNGTLKSIPIAIGDLVDLTGETPAPCGLGNIGAPDPNGVLHSDSGNVSAVIGDADFTYLVKVRAGSSGQAGYEELNRRELPWVFFRFRFNMDDGLIKTKFSLGSSSDPNGPDDKDYSPMPTIWVFRRFYSGSTFQEQLIQQIDQDLFKFLQIGIPTGSPSYP